jgi:hypothetical protein
VTNFEKVWSKLNEEEKMAILATTLPVAMYFVSQSTIAIPAMQQAPALAPALGLLALGEFERIRKKMKEVV